ncbi:MAG: hypothetical protein ACPHCJ_07710 [Oceanococcaceae bacterium]
MPVWRQQWLGSVLLFLTLWMGFGALINARNMDSFNLQHIGIEAIVERGQFWLEGSPTPQLQPLGDTFHHEGHVYAAKQPGQFMWGALAYWPVQAAGIRYQTDYHRAAALATWGSASLWLALGLVALQRLSLRWRPEQRWAGHALALTAATGTHLLAYSGLPHHDLIAAGLIACGFACSVTARSAFGWKQLLLATCAGLSYGWALSTSMLPAFALAPLCLYALISLPWKASLMGLLGILLGLLPLGVYNSLSFGQPWLMANVVGNFADTFWRFEASNLLDKLHFYARQSLLYAPILWQGLIGLCRLPARLEAASIGLALLALLGYIANIDTVGHCQYGPRYLLPLLPLLCLGLLGLWRGPWPLFAGALSLLAAGYGLLINLGGALDGAMYCSYWEFAGARSWERVLHGGALIRPLAVLQWPALGCGLLWLLWLRSAGGIPRRAAASGSTPSPA